MKTQPLANGGVMVGIVCVQCGRESTSTVYDLGKDRKLVAQQAWETLAVSGWDLARELCAECQRGHAESGARREGTMSDETQSDLVRKWEDALKNAPNGAYILPPRCDCPPDHRHVAGASAIQTDAGGQILVHSTICCFCGQLRVIYYGIKEEGHGPYVSYEDMPKLVLPGGPVGPR